VQTCALPICAGAHGGGRPDRSDGDRSRSRRRRSRLRDHARADADVLRDEREVATRALHETLQHALDVALRAPAWTAYLLLALAVLAAALGPRGQRPINAAM